MSPDRLKLALEAGLKAVRQMAPELKAHWGQIEHETKAGEHHQLVTKLDRKTEKFLAKELAEFDPELGFEGEEYGVHKAAETFWLTDPIDGTIAFIRGLPFCTTMLALIDKGQVLIGIIHDFVRDESYWAIKGQGAFKDGQPISVSKHCFETGMITSLETKQSAFHAALSDHLRQLKHSRVMLTHNSGFELAMLATGKIDARISYQGFGKPYDYAPGSLIVTEAGGIVMNLGSGGYDYTNCNFIAANPASYRDLTTGPQAVFRDGQPIIGLLA